MDNDSSHTLEERDSSSIPVRYVPLCSCRVRKLDYAKIINEPHGPDFDSDVFND